ncbi:major histocompatibility complex class I-related gene protein-like [Carassius auratus]|uniref:Major histocompatibility complex class I-related gene protein-like n=1 Tax=Carassius auratus TaxID=7957 RepID=A0A6P6NI76_CARAU|nr:major histocompatibility complex class I-related gene protein-like [Carassius auratus]
MIFIIFLIYVPFIHSVSHTLITTYTGVNRQMAAEFPEVSAVTILDGLQIDYYDSVTKKLIPTQDWMKEFASTDRWEEYTEIRERVQQINKINIRFIMEQFNQTRALSGVHTYQRVYGCDLDDETGNRRGFDKYTYDGQRFITLDLEKIRYTASVPQAEPTVMNWNEDRKQLAYLKQYYRYKCVYWLKELLHYSKASFEKTGKVPESTEQILTEPGVIDNKSNRSASYPLYIGLLIFIIILVFLILILFCIILYALWNIRNQFKPYYNKVRYYKENNSTPQNTSPTEDCSQSEQSLIESSEPLAPSPEEGSSSPEEGSSSPEEGPSSPLLNN